MAAGWLPSRHDFDDSRPLPLPRRAWPAAQRPMTTARCLVLTTLLAAGTAGCRGGDPPAAAGPGAMPPMEVKTITLAARPVPQSSEFIASIRSLRSTTVQPQVEGIVRRIFVTAGARVRAGEPLAQIDPEKQQASVTTWQSARVAREAEVAFTRQQLVRMETLLEAGAVSRAEMEQAQTAHTTAQAQLNALESQIRESQVELQYLPRHGAGLRHRRRDPRPRGRPRHPLDHNHHHRRGTGPRSLHRRPARAAPPACGLACRWNCSTAPGRWWRSTRHVRRASGRRKTQSVLAKATLRSVPPGARVEQYVRARLVWSSAPALAVPVVAVNRVSGQYFVFVAEQGQGGFVARQKPITVGEVVGEDYVVTAGLQAGQRVIVSNVQKLGDGAPVAPGRQLTPCSSTPSSAPCPGVGRVAGHRAGRRAGDPDHAGGAVPGRGPPQVSVLAVYTGANAETVETAVTTPIEQAINGVEGMLYMTSASTQQRRRARSTSVFDVTRNQDLAAVDVQNRVSQALGRMPGEVRQTGITVQKQANNFVMGAGVFSAGGEYDSLFLSNYIDVYVKDALKRVPGVADVMIFGERKYSMRLWLDPVRLAARGITAGDVVDALREQNVQVAAGSVGEAPARAGQTYQISVRAAGRLRERAEFESIIVKAGERGSLVRLRDVGSAELGAETYASTLRFQGLDAVGFGVIALPTANALDVEKGVIEELDRLQRAFPRGCSTASPSTPPR